MKYKITLVCFCYSGDENILPYSLKSANNTFGKDLKIVLIDDDNNPISSTTLDNLKKTLTCDFVYEKSSFNRNKNLNGRECVLGEIDYFIKHTKDREGLLIKLDPDTMILKRDVFDTFMRLENVDYASPVSPIQHRSRFIGMCYAIKTRILEAGKKILHSFEMDEINAPEDHVIGLGMAAASIPNFAFKMESNNSDDKITDFISWNYDCQINEPNIKMYYDKYQVITYGNWFLHNGLVKDDRIEPMKEMLKYQEKNINVTVVMFTYKGDENIVQYSLKSVNDLLGDNIKIALIDDNSNPMSTDIVDNLKNILTCDFVYEKSCFKRNGGLYGKECLIGMLDCYLKHTKDRDGVLIKLDPDTMMVKRKVLDDFLSNDRTFYKAPSFNTYPCKNYYCGNIVFIKTKILEYAQKLLNSFPLTEYSEEDHFIGLACSVASIPLKPDMFTVWHLGMDKADFCFWNFNNPNCKENMKLYHDMYDVVSFGNIIVHPDKTREDIKEPMQMMLEYIENV